MIVRLHKLARTTPAIRAEIAASDESIQTLAQRYGVSPMTVFKWKHRTSFEDRPHTPHRLPTTLTAAQEIIAVQLRKTLLLSLDDLLAVMREFVNPDVSRSGLDRCLRRHGVSNLKALQPQARKAAHAPFAADEPGYVHIDVKYLPQMADEDRRRYLFVAIDRAQRSSVHPGQEHQERTSGSLVSVGPHQGLPGAHPHDPHGQRQGVHRPLCHHGRAHAHGAARLR